MLIGDITHYLESRYPLSLQESYDNCGLTYGHKTHEVQGILFALDVTEGIVREAISKKCNLIISHHPVVFKGLKQINGSNMTERVLELCIKNDIALYAIHTNLDNHKEGVNKRIADKIETFEPRVSDVKISLDEVNRNELNMTIYFRVINSINVEEIQYILTRTR